MKMIKGHEGDAAEEAMTEHILRTRDDMLTSYKYK